MATVPHCPFWNCFLYSEWDGNPTPIFSEGLSAACRCIRKAGVSCKVFGEVRDSTPPTAWVVCASGRGQFLSTIAIDPTQACNATWEDLKRSVTKTHPAAWERWPCHSEQEKRQILKMLVNYSAVRLCKWWWLPTLFGIILLFYSSLLSWNYCPWTRFLFFFFFHHTGFWTQGLYFEPFHQPFLVMGFFEIGFRELFVQVGSESQSSWSLPSE
jgi:hypothetical protein